MFIDAGAVQQYSIKKCSQPMRDSPLEATARAASGWYSLGAPEVARGLKLYLGEASTISAVWTPLK